MKKIKNKFSSDVFIYLISNVVYFSIPFFLLPILTRVLSVEEYGTLGLFQTLCVLFIHFISLGCQSYIVRSHFDDANDESLVIVSNYSIYVAMFFIITLCVLAVDALAFWSFSISPFYVLVAVLCAFLTCIMNVRLFIYQAQKQPIKYGITQISNSALNVFITLIFVLSVLPNVNGRIMAIVISLSMVAIYCTYTLKSYFTSGAASGGILPGVKKSLYFGVPLLPHLLGAFLISYFDRFFIESNFTLADVGLYVLAVQISSIYGFLFDSVQKAYIPYLFSFLRDGGRMEILYKKFAMYFGIVMLFPFAFLLFGVNFIEFYAGEAYIPAANLVFVLLVGQGFRGMYLIFSGFLSYYKYNFLQSCITVFCGFISVFLMFFLSDVYGLLGVALANAVAMFLFLLITFCAALILTKRGGGLVC